MSNNLLSIKIDNGDYHIEVESFYKSLYGLNELFSRVLKSKKY